MFKLPNLRQHQGFTVVEIVVSLAIIGLTTVVLAASFITPNNNERFTGEVKEFADFLRQAQVKAFTVESQACPSGGTCYSRGNVVELSTDGAELKFLYGADLSQYANNLNQKQGLREKSGAVSSYNLAAKGISIRSIKIISGGVTTTPANASIAFLAPDGRSFLSNSLAPSPFALSEPYSTTGRIEVELVDEGVSLTGLVTFDSASGTITTRIR